MCIRSITILKIRRLNKNPQTKKKIKDWKFSAKIAPQLRTTITIQKFKCKKYRSEAASSSCVPYCWFPREKDDKTIKNWYGYILRLIDRSKVDAPWLQIVEENSSSSNGNKMKQEVNARSGASYRAKIALKARVHRGEFDSRRPLVWQIA